MKRVIAESYDVRPGTITSAAGGVKTSQGSSWATDEALRLVQLIFLNHAQRPPQVVVIAGVDHGSGCSQICAAVAETLAKNSGKPVCLVEGNFRTPALSKMYGVRNDSGLTDVLTAEAPIRKFTQTIGYENLCLLAAGPLTANSPDLLSLGQLRERMQELREIFAFVIVDTPPLTRYSDALVFAQMSDGLVLIIEAESTRREAALAAVQDVRSADVEVLAAVFNKRTFPIPENVYRKL